MTIGQTSQEKCFFKTHRSKKRKKKQGSEDDLVPVNSEEVFKKVENI